MSTPLRYILPVLATVCLYASGEAFHAANYTHAAFRMGCAIFLMMAEIARAVRAGKE